MRATVYPPQPARIVLNGPISPVTGDAIHFNALVVSITEATKIRDSLSQAIREAQA